eukprot:g27332.t1
MRQMLQSTASSRQSSDHASNIPGCFYSRHWWAHETIQEWKEASTPNSAYAPTSFVRPLPRSPSYRPASTTLLPSSVHASSITGVPTLASPIPPALVCPPVSSSVCPASPSASPPAPSV